MPIEKISNILKDADQNGYGVAAFNVFNYESIAWAIEVAEEEKTPIIIQFYPGFHVHIPLSTVVSIAVDLAANVKVPIGLHLDHSHTFEQVMSGVKYGYPSVMIDGSLLDFDENVKLTRKVVECAHAMGVEVEAELGHVGSAAIREDFTNPNHFTDPEAAKRFVDLTGVDSLAISVGNAHGQYISAPVLDFERIKKINSLVEVPLVLHGGSGIPDDQLQKSIQLGMNKFNIATEYNRAFYEGLKPYMLESDARGYMYGCLNRAKEAVKNFLRNKIRTLNPKGYHL